MGQLPPAAAWEKIISLLPEQARRRITARVNLADPPPVGEFAAELVERLPPHELRSLTLAGFFENLLYDPEVLPVAEAQTVFRRLLRRDVAYVDRLLAHLSKDGRDPLHDSPEEEICRALDIIRGSGDLDRINLPLQRFLRAPYASVRSRAAKVAAEGVRQESWFDRMLRDQDPRVRANIVDSLGQLPSLTPGLRALLTRAKADSHHRVRAGALMALGANGDESSAREIAALLTHDDPNFRNAARWAMKSLAQRRRAAKATESKSPAEVPS